MHSSSDKSSKRKNDVETSKRNSSSESSKGSSVTYFINYNGREAINYPIQNKVKID